jgi:hypothetical protein
MSAFSLARCGFASASSGTHNFGFNTADLGLEPTNAIQRNIPKPPYYRRLGFHYVHMQVQRPSALEAELG